MRIAVASGKGGTGKTTVAVNLALSMTDAHRRTSYCDCDVEAPNGHVFLKPQDQGTETVNVLIPQVNQDLCDGCKLCADICEFSAIIVMKGTVVTYPELCHSCGGCRLVCPHKAITEVPRPVGEIESGRSGAIGYVGGRLTIGEASAVPLIRQVKEKLPASGIAIIDAPPGTSCPVIETVRDADYVILVTEPTPFGFNDLKLAIETMQQLKRPFGVVINRADIGNDEVETYCREQGIEVLLRIPFSREIAETYSRGDVLIERFEEQRELYKKLAGRLLDMQPDRKADVKTIRTQSYTVRIHR